MRLNANKVVVAVHGIGDQRPFETLRAVANQYSAMVSNLETITLGGLYPQLRPFRERERLKELRTFFPGLDHPNPLSELQPPPWLHSERYCAWNELSHVPGDCPDWLIDPEASPPPPAIEVTTPRLGLTEVYWADIARRFAAGRLDSLAHWSDALVQRMRLRTRFPNFRYRDADERLAGDQVALAALAARRDHQNQHTEAYAHAIKDMVGSLQNLGHLLKIGRIKLVDLDTLLVEYLGDVQLFAEYPLVRSQIVKRFTDKLATVAIEHRLQQELALAGGRSATPAAAKQVASEEEQSQAGMDGGELEIHLVSHSLGTVVALHGLLEALAYPDAYPWIYSVKSLVTLGSPIDKFFFLWPSLVAEHEQQVSRAPLTLPERIRWINLYDFNDPVGYQLDDARNADLLPWIAQHFDFDARDDVGFYRYGVPGVAHIDYWQDEELFRRIALRTIWPDMHSHRAAPALDCHRRLHKVHRKPKLWLLLIWLVFLGFLGWAGSQIGGIVSGFLEDSAQAGAFATTVAVLERLVPLGVLVALLVLALRLISAVTRLGWQFGKTQKEDENVIHWWRYIPGIPAAGKESGS